MKRLSFTYVLVFLLMFSFAAPAEAGKLGKGDPNGTPGEWFTGEIPNQVKDGSYPLVFVHGLNSSSSTWIDDNNMDEITYNKNYWTAYINLYPTKNMWDNGKLLSDKLKEMYEHFGQKVILITHSKGGVDAQSALIHHDAYQYVEKVITLSTPHHGSQLADLAYSSWAGWLAEIIGNKNDATHSLQTGYMSYFRDITDSDPNRSLTPYYTFGGTDWGSFGGSLYWGGLYLSQYGKNDGAVTVASSRLSYGNEIKVSDWDHSSIKEGSSTFPLFEPYLSTKQPTIQPLKKSFITPEVEIASTSREEQSSEEANILVRGGQYSGQTEESFSVEGGTDTIMLDWMSQYENSNITLIGPDKQEYTPSSVFKDESMFKGAYHHQIKVNNPSDGQWTLFAKHNQSESYLMQVSFESDLNDEMKLDKQALTAKKVEVETDNNKIKRDTIKGDIIIQYSKNGKTKQQRLTKEKFNKLEELPIKNAGQGVYHIMMDIEGDTTDNKSFERTLLHTIYIDEKGKVHRP